MDESKTVDNRADSPDHGLATLGLAANLSREEPPSQLFFQFTQRLKTHFEINKGVLLLRLSADAPLAAVSIWNNGQTREGLSIKLPSESSLFEKVAECGRVYTENFCGSFSGNFFERKLLIEDDSRSFVLQPLRHRGEVIGMIGYSSDEPTAFTLFEEGVLDDVVAEFTKIIREKLWSL